VRSTILTSPLSQALLVTLAVSGALVTLLLVGRAHGEQSRLYAEQDVRTWPTARWGVEPDDFPGADVGRPDRPAVPKDDPTSALYALPVVAPLTSYSAFLEEHRLAAASDDGAVADTWLRVGEEHVLTSVVHTTRHPPPDPFAGEPVPHDERIDRAVRWSCDEFRGLAWPDEDRNYRDVGELCPEDPYRDPPAVTRDVPATMTGYTGAQLETVQALDRGEGSSGIEVRRRTTLVMTRVDDALLLVGVTGPADLPPRLDAVTLLDDLAAQVRADPPTYAD
jgi:hypothetical protein